MTFTAERPEDGRLTQRPPRSPCSQDRWLFLWPLGLLSTFIAASKIAPRDEARLAATFGGPDAEETRVKAPRKYGGASGSEIGQSEQRGQRAAPFSVLSKPDLAAGPIG